MKGPGLRSCGAGLVVRFVSQIRVKSFVVNMRDEAMIGVMVWLDALVGKPDESKT